MVLLSFSYPPLNTNCCGRGGSSGGSGGWGSGSGSGGGASR